MSNDSNNKALQHYRSHVGEYRRNLNRLVNSADEEEKLTNDNNERLAIFQTLITRVRELKKEFNL